MAHDEPRAFDPNDPHGFGDLGEHHGHHITDWKILAGVLGALLVFTGLTVFASEFETYLTSELGWFLPDWVNVMVAMSIATVKATLVVMFFMALKYENPLYTIVFLFCLFAFALFLGLTGMDLDNRGHVQPWKQDAKILGGTGVGITKGESTFKLKEDDFGEITISETSFNNSLTERLKQDYIAATGITEEEYWKLWAKANHVHEHHDDHLSSANRSRPHSGISGALDLESHDEDHHDDHSGH